MCSERDPPCLLCNHCTSLPFCSWGKNCQNKISSSNCEKPLCNLTTTKVIDVKHQEWVGSRKAIAKKFKYHNIHKTMCTYSKTPPIICWIYQTFLLETTLMCIRQLSYNSKKHAMFKYHFLCGSHLENIGMMLSHYWGNLRVETFHIWY
jgi:hypothetical protein